jgi:hypothetical protein
VGGERERGEVGGDSGYGESWGVSLEIWLRGASVTDKFIWERARRKAAWSGTEFQFICLGCVTDANAEYSVCR